MKFHENLQKLRKEKGLSQENLAEQLDVTRQSVSKWESGTSYPEMDKLITLCKIFDCDLDSLVNGEVDKEKTSSCKETIPGKAIFQKFDTVMKKIVLFFETMSAKDLIKFLVELCIIFFIIFLFRIPFALLEDLVSSFLYRYGRLSFLSNLFSFFIQLAYGLLAIAAFLYVIKIKYIDKVDDTKLVTEKIPVERIFKEKVEEDQKTGEMIKKIYVKKQGKNVSDVLTTLIVSFLKFLVLLFLFGSFIGLICLIVLFGISTSFAIEGLPVVGVSIGLFGAILLVLCIIEPATNFVLNHKNAFKRLLITFVISLVLLGVGTTVFTLDFLDITYVDKAPSQYEKHMESREFNMPLTLHTCYLPHRYLAYEKDESLENVVRVNYTYYGNKNLEIAREQSGGLYILYGDSEEEFHFQEFLKIVKEDLKNRRLYNYDQYNTIEITIQSSAKNIEKIMENNKTCY